MMKKEKDEESKSRHLVSEVLNLWVYNSKYSCCTYTTHKQGVSFSRPHFNESRDALGVGVVSNVSLSEKKS